MEKLASKVVEQVKSWLGKNEADGSHKEIIDIYNAHKPLARDYKVKYSDPWCATNVSAVAIKLGYTDIIPTECSCTKMIELFKKLGAFVEDDSYVPAPGDILFYDWDDSGKGDSKGDSEHVGIVEKVANGKITVIEGNYNNAVKRRTIPVNGQYIRGYGVPKYDKEETVKPAKKDVLTVDGMWGKETTKASQRAMKTPVDGIVSNQPASCQRYVPSALSSSWEFKTSKYSAGSVLIKAIQKLVGSTMDGLCGKNTVTAMQKFLKSKGLYTDTVDGIMGPNTVKGWQKYINSIK